MWLFYLGAALFLINVVSQIYFAYTRSRFPEPLLGRIYELRVHSTMVYLTMGENMLAGRFLWVMAALCFAAWAFLGFSGREGRT